MTIQKSLNLKSSHSQ